MFSDLISIVRKMQSCKVMIIGDMVADVYLEGEVSRISREAPVLILKYSGETVVPGGAANTVNNAASLGGIVWAAGVIGQDVPGDRLKQVFMGKGVISDGLVSDDQRPTITKTRVMAGGQATVRQQIVRIDRETDKPISTSIEEKLLTWIENNIEHVSAIVISDYGSGTVTERLRSKVINISREYSIPSLVDSRYDILSYYGIGLIKQNEAEAAAALGMETIGAAELDDAGLTLLKRTNAGAVLITRGPDGMSLFQRGRQPIHMPVTNKSEVYDVTGAGDTVVAAIALALAGGASYERAAAIANFAAGIVVRKPGTATVTVEELRKAIEEYYEGH